MQSTREFALSVVAGAAAAGLTLYAAAQTWQVTEGYRPVPLPPLGIEESGNQLLPVLPAFGWVALAAVGALLATKGMARLIVAIILLVTGLGIFTAAFTGFTRYDDAAPWPVLAMLAGLVVAGVGMTALRHSSRWPAMGARYERSTRSAAPQATDAGAGSDDATRLWDAIDRGDDPTRPDQAD